MSGNFVQQFRQKKIEQTKELCKQNEIFVQKTEERPKTIYTQKVNLITIEILLAKNAHIINVIFLA